MYTYVAIFASIVLFAGVSHAAAPVDPSSISCLEADRGYNLIKQDGTIDVVRLYSHAVKKFGDSSLNRQTSAQLHQFGVTTGDPREWARLFVMVCKQESGCRMARTYPDGSLEKFPSTLQSERSYGPLQFNIGEYGLNSWAMVNSPSCSLEAFIRVAQQGKLFAYFGSMQRPQEILQHANWFNTTVQPYVDALTLTFDPNAPDMRAYQGVAPYFVNPQNGMPLGSGYGNPYGMQQQPSILSLLSGQSQYGLQNAMQPNPYAASPLNSSSQVLQNNQQPTQSSSGPSTQYSSSRLLAQPSAVRSGGSVILAWTSVGMRTGSCSVRAGDTVLATSPEGSLRYPVTAAVQDDIAFRFTCKDALGADVASDAVVQVE